MIAPIIIDANIHSICLNDICILIIYDRDINSIINTNRSVYLNFISDIDTLAYWDNSQILKYKNPNSNRNC